MADGGRFCSQVSCKIKFAHVMSGTKGSSAYVGPDNTKLEAKNGVRIVSTESNKTVLHITERQVVWDVPAVAKDLDTTHVVSHRITSDDDKDLSIRSSANLEVRGNENFFIDSHDLNVTAKKGGITLQVGNTEENMISFQAPKYRFNNVPTVSLVDAVVKEKMYRLCICANNYKLFKIDAESGHRCKNAVSACLT